LKEHTTADLFNKLQAFFDYLLLPGTFAKYLPDRSKMPLIHVSVFDLHCQTAAKDVVQVILSSTAFSDVRICKDISSCLYRRTAFFYLSAIPDDTCVVKVKAYAVPTSQFSKRCRDSGTSGTPSSTMPVMFYNDASLEPLPEHAASSSLINQIKAAPPIPAGHQVLVPMSKAGLQEGLAAAGSKVNGIQMQVAMIKADTRLNAHQRASTPLWVVHW
jgi:hypothetical protein